MGGVTMRFDSLRLPQLPLVLVLLFLGWSAQAGDRLQLRSGSVALNRLQGQHVEESRQTPGIVVLQWSNRIDASTQQLLERRGLEVLRYLPEDALVIRNRGYSLDTLTAELGARAASALSSDWKVDPAVLAARDSGKKWVLISLFSGSNMSAFLQDLRRIPEISVLRLSSGEVAVALRGESLRQVASHDEVEWIQDLPIWQTLDFAMNASDRAASVAATPPALTGYESGTKLIGFEEAWMRGFTGKGQVVSMADTGVDTGVVATLHEDLRSVVLKGYPLGIGAKVWEDPQGHGTHVCGSVVGTGARSGGAIRGGAYQATMLPSSIWSPIMDNLAFPSDFNQLFKPPYQDGARVHTNSWGSPRNPGAYDGFASSVDKFVWENPDFLVLFAAGNSGEDLDRDGRIDPGSVGSPATAKNVLSVGASENLLATGGIQREVGKLRDGEKKWGVEPLASDKLSNNPNGIAAFSSRGPTLDGRIKPEIVAPGTNIVSTRSHHPKASLLWGEYDSEYVYAGGTSMATPITAGAAVIARQYLIEKASVSSPSAALIKATLVHSAIDLFPGQFGVGPKQELPTPRPNIHEGYGRVDLDRLTQLAGRTLFIDSRDGVASGATQEVSVDVAAGAGFRATLVYTDAPAAPAAARALVNDIDLEVVTPSGEVKSLNDSTNNLEMIEMGAAQAQAGTYRVRVKGKNIPQGKNGRQPYALVVSSS
jgi:subtilisin family serine protease